MGNMADVRLAEAEDVGGMAESLALAMPAAT